MIFQSPGATALHLGPLDIRWYGVLIACGMVGAYMLAIRLAKRAGLSPLHVENMALWVVLSGIIGARLYYVLFNLHYYLATPLEVVAVWHGGLAIHGGLIGGAIAFFAYCIYHKIQPLAYADVLVPGLLFAQALGRWGNFFNSEAFGRPTDLPWKLFIQPTSRPPGFESFSYFHPTFLYESVWNILGVLLLLFIARRGVISRTPGTLLFVYLIVYSFGRFFIEGLRLDSLYAGPLRAAQVVSILLFCVGLFGLFFAHRRRRVKDTYH